MHTWRPFHIHPACPLRCPPHTSPVTQEQLEGKKGEELTRHVELVRMKYRIYHTPFEPSAHLPVYALEWSLLGCRMSDCPHPEFDVGAACAKERPQASLP